MVTVKNKLIAAAIPEGSVFKRYKDNAVQDPIISVEAIRYRRISERHRLCHS